MKGFLSVLLLAIGSCSSNPHNTKPAANTIEIGNYAFDFPGDCHLVKEHGVDSYVGGIVGKDIGLGFDYGYYSDPLTLTREEYDNKRIWMIEASVNSATYKKVGGKGKVMASSIKALSSRPATRDDSVLCKGCDVISYCSFYGDTQLVAWSYPEATKQSHFQVDTIDGHVYRKIVWANDPVCGTTGIYLMELKDFDKSMNSPLALSMSTYEITKEQQEMLVKIFKSVRLVNKNTTNP